MLFRRCQLLGSVAKLNQPSRSFRISTFSPAPEMNSVVAKGRALARINIFIDSEIGPQTADPLKMQGKELIMSYCGCQSE